ncbi:hypothetical protein BDV18DRAFT_140559 [Aspergillus unguis]
MRSRFLNRVPLSYPIIPRRSFLQVTAQAKEPVIFEDSLEKTLQGHRSANRQSLIRKVVPQSSSQKPDHPTVPNTKPAKPSTSESPASQAQSSSTTLQDDSARKKNPRKSNRVRSKERLAPVDLFASSSINWRVKAGRSKQCPWLESLEQSRRFADGVSQLHEEILALARYLTPSVQEGKVADLVTTDAIDLIFKDASHPEILNIKRTGFTTSHSGLDLIISFGSLGSSTYAMKKRHTSHGGKLRKYDEFLDTARRSLEQHPSYKTTLNERQRTLAVLHRPTGLLFRISCAQDEPAYLEYLRDFHAEYVFLRPLYKTIRLILETKGLFGSARSCIDSNDLQMLIATFFKIKHGRYRRRANCAEPLLEFLHTFGSEIDLSSTGISTDPPGFFNTDTVEEAYRLTETEEVPAYLRGQRTLTKRKKTAAKMGNIPLATGLLIQSPWNYMRQLSSSCFRTTELQAAFADAHEQLKHALDAWEPSGKVTPSTSILGSALRANFDGFETRRASILTGVTSNKNI